MLELVMICFLNSYLAVFEPSEYKVTERGALVGRDLWNQRDDYIPPQMVRFCCLATPEENAREFLGKLQHGDVEWLLEEKQCVIPDTRL